MMIKNIKIISGAITFMLLSSVAQAQMFQDSNTACESKEITTVNNVQSIACRYHTGIADFDGSGFADCVAEDAFWNTPGDDNVAVLINNGAGQTCGSGTGQFAASVSYAEDNAVAGTTNIATALAGPVSPGARSVLMVPYVGGGTSGNVMADTSNASGVFTGTSTAYASGFFGVFQNGFSSATSGYNRTTAMFDCNNDNFQDVVITGFSTSVVASANALILQVLQKNSGTSFTASQATVLDTLTASAPYSTLAVGDFNGDGIPDVVVATGNKNGVVDPQIAVCVNDGSCGFTCSSAIDLVTEHPGFSAVEIQSNGVVAGDFNGDGRDDIALAVRAQNISDEFAGLDYYLNQGSSTFTHTFVSVTNSGGNYPENITTGYFNNDAILDVAGTLFGDSPVVSTVQVVTSNGSGGFNAPLELNFTADPTVDTVDSAWGIDSADFDHQGCDDIIALADDPVASTRGGRSAYIFMNTLESLSVSAGTAYEESAGSGVQLTGTCTLTPADTTTTASSIVPTWTIVGSPAGASLTNANTLTPTFSSTTNGTYTVQLSCVSQCVAATTATATVVVTGGFLEGSGLNGCSLGNAGSVSSMLGYLSVLGSILGMYAVRRKKN